MVFGISNWICALRENQRQINQVLNSYFKQNHRAKWCQIDLEQMIKKKKKNILHCKFFYQFERKVSDILKVRNTKRIIHFVRNLDNPKQYVPRYDILGLGDIVNYFYQKKSQVKRRPTYFKKKQSASSSLSSNKTPDHRGIDIHTG